MVNLFLVQWMESTGSGHHGASALSRAKVGLSNEVARASSHSMAARTALVQPMKRKNVTHTSVLVRHRSICTHAHCSFTSSSVTR